MAGLWQMELRRPARSIPFLVFSLAVIVTMIRAVDQPSIDLGLGGTDVSLVPADLVLAALAAFAGQRLLRRGSLPRPARAITYAAAAFSVWLLVSSGINGFGAFVGAAKLLEYSLLGIGAVLFIQRRRELWLFVALIVAITSFAVVYALFDFFGGQPFGFLPDRSGAGGRQASFLGEHDLVALSTMALAFGLSALYAPSHGRFNRLAIVAVVAGGIGVTLGAAIAGLIGLYLAIATLLALAGVRRELSRRVVALTAVVAILVTGGTLALRSNELDAFLRFLGVEERSAVQDENAASWSQRLIFVYIGGRVFLEHPIVGTGWHGNLPAEEFARFVPDARAKFPDQPARYFPPNENGEYVPQQTYDQILFELGAVGAILFLVLGAATIRTVVAVGREWPRGDLDGAAAYLAAAWVAALAGGLTGAALFGGLPQTAVFWLTLGVAALTPSLMPPRAILPPRASSAELVSTAR
jgi:hypothetical protein